MSRHWFQQYESICPLLGHWCGGHYHFQVLALGPFHCWRVDNIRMFQLNGPRFLVAILVLRLVSSHAESLWRNFFPLPCALSITVNARLDLPPHLAQGQICLPYAGLVRTARGNGWADTGVVENKANFRRVPFGAPVQPRC